MQTFNGADEEPVIKYEHCDDVYGVEHSNDNIQTMNPNYYNNQLQHSVNQQSSHHQTPGQRSHQSTATIAAAMKRTFDQMQQQQQQQNGSSSQSGNYNNANNINPYFSAHSSSYGGSGMTVHGPSDFDMFNQQLTNRVDNLYRSNAQSEGKPTKKYRRGESSILFSPPFFKLLDGFASPNHKDAIAARCYACGKVVRGNKSISSNFIKHMKRGHPEINKIYDSYKMYRIKTGVLPNISQIIAGCKMDSGKFDKDDSSGIVCDSNDDDNGSQYIDASVVLDSSEMGDGENEAENDADATEDNKNSENSENDDEFTNAKSIEGRDCNSENSHYRSRETEENPNHLEDVINKIVEEKLKDFVRQTDLDKFQKTSSDSASLEELKREVENLKKECSTLRLAVQQSQASKRQLQTELQSVDKLLHQRKLIIRNLKLDNELVPQKSVQTFLAKKLGLEDINIVNCTIIPSSKPSLDTKKKCVLIELQNHLDAKNILRQIPKLKDTGIFIEPEISPLQRKRKDKLMIIRKELLRRKVDLKVMVRNTTLVVEGQQFYWDDIEGLCHDANKEALELNAIEYLKKLTTLDLKEFIDIIQNYDVQVR
ncbi:uncharacterized protein LOC101898356 [Musca domestica]|uniref:Uncharacterized protein LOC101898356 n=1 Tax=Musca domestica TaxID=7370 RepID=A0A1I8M7R6_MUSDO|nr:uncharacterized protein LOC101898356 [Musca domestica]